MQLILHLAPKIVTWQFINDDNKAATSLNSLSTSLMVILGKVGSGRGASEAAGKRLDLSARLDSQQRPCLGEDVVLRSMRIDFNLG